MSTVSLLVRLFASICLFVFLVCLLPKCLLVYVSLTLFICLFFWLLPCSRHYICKMSLLLLSVFILWNNRCFHQSSPIIFYFIYSSVHWGRIQDIEFERHGLPLPVLCVGKPFKVSTNYFVLFILERVTFYFCVF